MPRPHTSGGPHLRQTLLLSHTTAMVVGTIIGASIFVEPSETSRALPSMASRRRRAAIRSRRQGHCRPCDERHDAQRHRVTVGSLINARISINDQKSLLTKDDTDEQSDLETWTSSRDVEFSPRQPTYPAAQHRNVEPIMSHSTRDPVMEIFDHFTLQTPSDRNKTIVIPLKEKPITAYGRPPRRLGPRNGEIPPGGRLGRMPEMGICSRLTRRLTPNFRFGRGTLRPQNRRRTSIFLGPDATNPATEGAPCG